MNLHTL